MKKTVITFLVAGVLVSAATTSVFAAEGGKHYTDSDNNGICDYTKQQVASCTALCNSLSNASSTVESVASKIVTNAKYMDADNDGVCDNYTGSGNGGGNGNSGNSNWGNDSGYVDSDNDGVCDNYTGSGNGGGCDNYADRVRPQDGTGNQYGCGHRKNR